MIKNIINYIEYKKKLRRLKMIAVNEIANIVINKSDYIFGFKKLLLTASQTDNADELQKLLNDFIELSHKTKLTNDVLKSKVE